jgi:hypothetical protein
MKTNHQREFVASKQRDQSMWEGCRRLESGYIAYATVEDYFATGNHRNALIKRAAKRRLRRLDRHDRRQITRQWTGTNWWVTAEQLGLVIEEFYDDDYLYDDDDYGYYDDYNLEQFARRLVIERYTRRSPLAAPLVSLMRYSTSR